MSCRRIYKTKYMAVNKIRFKGLPFRPERNQVFYIENGYDVEANHFIRSNYIDMKDMFRHIGMDFHYLPCLLKEHDIEAKIRYYAPYLSPMQLVMKVQSNAFVPYISDTGTKENLKPSFLFEGRQEGYTGNVRFLSVSLKDIDINDADAIKQLMHLILSAKEAFYIEEEEKRLQESRLYEIENHCICHQYREDAACEHPKTRPSAASDGGDGSHARECPKPEERDIRREQKPSSKRNGILGRLFMKAKACHKKPDNDEDLYKTEDELTEEQSFIETKKVLRELRMTVQKLRLEGVSLMAIHEFIDKQEPLSRMTITHDYRIFLPDYNNMEIEMGALPKAIYFLYLRYPDGIIYKHIPDYFSELLNIYKQLRPNTDKARLHLTITKVVNPLGNALNENIARIRKAFVEKFDEHLANNYIITGERGLQYSIPLDRNLITWEE